MKKIIAKVLGPNQNKFNVDLDDTECEHCKQQFFPILKNLFYSFIIDNHNVLLPNEHLVNKIMASRPLVLHSKEVFVSRQIPRTFYLSHQITYGLKVELSSPNGELTVSTKYD